MAQSSQAVVNDGWLKASGLQEFARALGFAMHPAKLGLALVGLVATLAYGGLLDWVWTRNGGVSANAVAQYVAYHERGQIYVEPAGPAGIFQSWRDHTQQSIQGLLATPLNFQSPGEFLSMGSRYLWQMGRGSWWMVRFHPVFFVLFALGALFIWSLMGGAICRIAAVQFARDEKITAWQALAFTRKRLVGGFMLAPLIPIVFMALIAGVMIAGGVFLRIPVLGDIVGAPLFVLALLGGLIIAVLAVGMLVGGGLFWPAVAVEGSDAFDSFSRSLAYPFSRPWKTVLYFFITGMFAVVSWLIVNFLVTWAVSITRGIVAWGTAPFGWWQRGEGVSKLELLWPMGGAGGLHSWPDWSQLEIYEKFSAGVIGIYVLLAVGLTWAFLFSFCLSSDTIIYFLLRRDVDGNDLADVLMEESSGGPPGGDRPATTSDAAASASS